MSDKLNPKTDPSEGTRPQVGASHQPMVYQIRLKGHLGCEWTDCFEGLAITLEDSGDTLLTGPVSDQAALYGLLRKVRDLGLSLLSVNCAKPDQVKASEIRPSDPIQ